MQCKTCDYRLWGIKGRECPECGTPFLPSQFVYVTNSVRFCCPDCGQDYYGTGENGHLVPPEFDCVRCGRHLQMDDMVLFTTEGVQEEQTQVERMPWFDTKRFGFFRRWFKTIWMGMVAPSRLVELTPTESSSGKSWWFATVTNAAASLAGASPFAIIPLVILLGGPARRAVAGVSGIVFLLGALLWPTVVIGIWAIFAHALVAMTGARQAGPRRTYQAMCYSSAPNILCAVPCLGVYFWPVAGVWWCVGAILMLRAGQKIGTGRAVTAVLTPVAVVLAGITCAIVFYVVPTIKAAQASSLAAMQQANLNLLAIGIIGHAGANGGKPPGHACELITAGSVVSAFSFVANGNLALLRQVPVAGTNLEQFMTASASKQKTLAQQATQSLPPNVVAHRLGDYVFTYHGIDFTKTDPGLWIVVFAPQSPVPKSGFIRVAQAGGTVVALPVSSFSQSLATQNALRKSQGLRPLPDPRGVTHSQPAAGP